MTDLKIVPHETKEITNTEDYLYSRDIQERIDYLDSIRVKPGMSEPEYAEYTILTALKKECVDYFGQSWEYGMQLIRDDYFEEYAQDLARDIGAINDDMRWPANCIDWEEAADELKMDYTEVDFCGEVFFTREA